VLEHAVFVEHCRLAAGMIDPSPEVPLVTAVRSLEELEQDEMES
jgi:hypothetical protein